MSHLSGIGEYESDAWRLFCEEHFYASHGIVIDDEWRTLNPNDRALQRYVERKRREEASERDQRLADEIALPMRDLDVSRPMEQPATPSPFGGIVVSYDVYAL